MSVLLRFVVLALVLVAAMAACSDGDGSSGRLVLTRESGIVEYALGSGEERMVVAQENDTLLLDPAVSPDGTQLAFVRQLTPIVLPGEPTDFGSDVYVASADGSNARLLREHEERGELVRSPVWLPSGDAVIVSVQRIEGGQVTSTLERIDVATGERTALFDNAFQPGLSPDGTEVVFFRTEPDFTQSLWIAGTDGSDERRIAGAGDNLVSFYSPRFSPDGQSIAFGAAEPVAPASRRSDLLALRSGTAPISRANEAPLYNGLPADVWVMELDGGTPEKVADLDLDQPSLTWSPDGATLYVIAGIGLYEIDASGGEAEQIGEGTFHGYVDWLGG